jgi:hypothetical protein
MKVHERLTIIPRYEWFKDLDGFVTGNAQTLQEQTLTFQLPVNDDSSVYLEYRRDWNKKTDPALFPTRGFYDISDPNFSYANPGASFVQVSRHFQHTITLGWTYAFKKE